ncbi:winged helix-turn-helix domain-containing protein [Deinococcus seoulensis]
MKGLCSPFNQSRYEFLRATGFTPQWPRPRYVGGDEAAKEAFKTKS